MVNIYFVYQTSRSCDVVCKIDYITYEKVQIGNDQEKAQSEKDSHSKNRGGKT